MNEMPQLTSCTYANTAYAMQNGGTLGNFATLASTPLPQSFTWDNSLVLPTTQESIMSTRRIVQVFIVDPNENIPLEKSLLYKSEDPFLTDLTDQELFFEIDIKNLLEKHNEYRVTVTDKDESSRDNQIKLEKAKIRDLKMVVTLVAQF